MKDFVIGVAFFGALAVGAVLVVPFLACAVDCYWTWAASVIGD